MTLPSYWHHFTKKEKSETARRISFYQDLTWQVNPTEGRERERSCIWTRSIMSTVEFDATFFTTGCTNVYLGRFHWNFNCLCSCFNMYGCNNVAYSRFAHMFQQNFAWEETYSNKPLVHSPNEGKQQTPRKVEICLAI